jgi:metallophosphoesterase superfamily enzyme
MQFVLDTFEEWKITKVISIGDLADLHNPSFHDNHPEMPGAKNEFEMASQDVARWFTALDDAGFVPEGEDIDICEGNHDDRPKRVAAKFGVTKKFLKPLSEVWPGRWNWELEHEIDGVLYMHGHRKCGGGMHPAHLTLKKGLDMSLVLGHFHTIGGVNPLPGRKALRWGMDVGCLVDRLHPAMAYARGAAKQMMSCGVVIDGHPYYEMMPCGPGELYNRRNFRRIRYKGLSR